MLIPRHRLLVSCAPHLTLEKVHALEIRAHTFNVPSMGGQRPKGNTVVESTNFTHMSHITYIYIYGLVASKKPKHFTHQTLSDIKEMMQLRATFLWPDDVYRIGLEGTIGRTGL